MKRFITYSFTLIVLATAWMVGTAQAQSSVTVKANIPFEFSFGDKTFPAGEYSIARPMQNFISLRDGRGHTLAVAFTQQVETLAAAPKASRLSFEQINDRPTLVEVWTEFDPVGQQLSRANSELKLARQRTTYTQVSAIQTRQ